jgi:hypothetical protein
MKNRWPFLLVSLLWVGVSTSAFSEPKIDDDTNVRAHRRAELRSALSAPVPAKGREGEKADNIGFHEHQLSAQEKADLRRQLREQFRVIGFDSAR